MLHNFRNRAEAAEALAQALDDYRGRKALILAIPRGAVPMGKIIAERLQGELDVVLVRKLGAPFDPEYALGAVDESGWTYIPEQDKRDPRYGSFLEEEKQLQLEVLRQRRASYTPCRAPADPEGRIVIVVDDGIATGATMMAALHAVRARKPAQLICAVPVASRESAETIAPLVDRFVCLHIPAMLFSIGAFYRDFSQVDDAEVRKLLSEARTRAGTPD